MTRFTALENADKKEGFKCPKSLLFMMALQAFFARARRLQNKHFFSNFLSCFFTPPKYAKIRLLWVAPEMWERGFAKLAQSIFVCQISSA